MEKANSQLQKTQASVSTTPTADADKTKGKSDAKTEKEKKKLLAREKVEKENERRRILMQAMYSDEAKTVAKDFVEILHAFKTYKWKDLDLTVRGYSSSNLTEELLEFMYKLTEANMKELYENAPGWGWNEKRKKREFTDEAARFAVVFDKIIKKENGEDKSDDNLASASSAANSNGGDGDTKESNVIEIPVAFIHFRFLFEGDALALYVYEIQVAESHWQKGIGKHLMRIAELAARMAKMEWVMLTVFTENVSALKFYKSLGFKEDASSPSLSSVHSFVGNFDDSPHKILSKCLIQAPKPVVSSTIQNTTSEKALAQALEKKLLI